MISCYLHNTSWQPLMFLHSLLGDVRTFIWNFHKLNRREHKCQSDISVMILTCRWSLTLFCYSPSSIYSCVGQIIVCMCVGGWGSCFYVQWIIVQRGMCPYQGKLTTPAVQLSAGKHPPPPLSGPDVVAHVGLMVQKQPKLNSVGMWWRNRGFAGARLNHLIIH